MMLPVSASVHLAPGTFDSPWSHSCVDMLHLRSSPTTHYDVLGTLEGLLRAGCGRCLEDVLDHTTEDPPLIEGRPCLYHDEELSAAHFTQWEG